MKFLVLADDAKARRLRVNVFPEDPESALLASSLQELNDRAHKSEFRIALADLDMASASCPDLLRELQLLCPGLPVIALCSEASRLDPDAAQALGIRQHLVRPFALDELRAAIGTHSLAQPLPSEQKAEAAPPSSRSAEEEVFFADPLMKKTLDMAVRAAVSSATILILGESGTGKTVLARLIHRQSPLATKPLVTVNCPCLSRELLESELFGHVKGAFTGAVQDTWGKVAAAEGGTLFLDEVGDLPPELQAKLLRLLQEREYERLGEAHARRANVRVVAATNRDLKAAVAAGHFREDLFYRLNVISFVVPPLRQRALDIPLAAEKFLATISAQLGRPAPYLTAAARGALMAHPWPGNLREMRNVIERAVVLSDNEELDAADFPELGGNARSSSAPALQIGEHVTLQTIEDAHIREVIARSPSLDYAARILGIDKSTLYRKRLKMQPEVSLFPLSSINGSAALV